MYCTSCTVHESLQKSRGPLCCIHVHVVHVVYESMYESIQTMIQSNAIIMQYFRPQFSQKVLHYNENFSENLVKNEHEVNPS